MNNSLPDAPDESDDEQSRLDTIIIDIPRIGDDLIALCSKLTAIANVITAGKSVAVATA